MKTNTRLTIAIGCLAPLAFSCQQEVKTQEQPNVIFILVDDMGIGELSCYNHASEVKTVNIDRIARSGVLMTQAYASPVSSPTRACFLTGQFPYNVGVYGNHDGPNPGVGKYRECFAPELQKLGYKTAWIGKWHQGWDIANHPANNGFDYTYGFLGGMHDYYAVDEGDYPVGGPFAKNSFVFDGFQPEDTMKYLTEELTDRAMAFIAELKSEPFFMYLAYNAPHTPIQAPDDVIVKYLKAGHDPMTAARCAMVDVLDRQVGRLLDELDRSGISDNTMVVFMGDNGAEKESRNGGFRGTKMTLWEGGVRVPMLACYPEAIPADTKSNSICSIVDMAATTIGMAKRDPGFKYGDGVNIMPYLSGQKTGNAHDELAFMIQYNQPPHTKPSREMFQMYALRVGDWKIVVDKRRNEDALYDLADDPYETRNLIAENPEKRNELYRRMDEIVANAAPGCGAIQAYNTRLDGDKIKRDSMVLHCEKLMKSL